MIQLGKNTCSRHTGGEQRAPAGAGPGEGRAAKATGDGPRNEKERPVALKEIQPILWVSNIERSVEFYQRKLGFDLGFAMTGDGGVMVHASVINGDVTLMLGYKDEATTPVEGRLLGGGAELYTYVDDVDAYFAQARAAGSVFTQEVTDQYWGDRTFTVTDPDGYVLTFAQTVRAFAPDLPVAATV
jgi:PhnB protein